MLNIFDFTGFDYKTKTLELIWISNKHDWVPIDNPSMFCITICDVEYLLILPNEDPSSISDESCLSDLSYYPSDEREENECVGDQELSLPSDDIVFKFESGQTIRVKGNEINAEYE